MRVLWSMIRAKVLVVRGSPVHYLLVRANRYSGRVGLVDDTEHAVRQLLRQTTGAGRHDNDSDDDDDDVVLLTDAVVADYIARQVRITCRVLAYACPAYINQSINQSINQLLSN